MCLLCARVYMRVCVMHVGKEMVDTHSHTHPTHTHIQIYTQKLQKAMAVKAKPGDEERKKRDLLMIMKEKKMLTDGADELDRMITDHEQLDKALHLNNLIPTLKEMWNILNHNCV